MWELHLYVSGETARTRVAIDNLRNICDIYLKDRCHIEVIDLQKHPELASREEIFAIPTLVKKLPPPVRKLIGDLHSTEKVLVGLDIRHHKHG
jgi:circadian clock protein KaiB